MARVYPLKETTVGDADGDWQLWFQWCRFELDDTLYGYRFIWRRPEGSLQAARGQARIPSIDAALRLMNKAKSEGWGDRDGDKMEAAARRLEENGCIVNRKTGYVGWKNKEESTKRHLNEEIISDTKILQEWS